MGPFVRSASPVPWRAVELFARVSERHCVTLAWEVLRRGPR